MSWYMLLASIVNGGKSHGQNGFSRKVHWLWEIAVRQESHFPSGNLGNGDLPPQKEGGNMGAFSFVPCISHESIVKMRRKKICYIYIKESTPGGGGDLQICPEELLLPEKGA